MSEGSYIVRLGDIETDIIEAVRSQDAVGGLKAFMRYRAAIEAEVREDLARQVARLPNPYDAKAPNEAHDEAYLMAPAVGYDFALKDAARTALQAPDPLEGGEA